MLAADTKRLSYLLEFVFSNGGRVSFDSLAQKFPDFVPGRDAKMLFIIDGVILLNKEMQGISLASRLEDRIREMAGQECENT